MRSKALLVLSLTAYSLCEGYTYAGRIPFSEKITSKGYEQIENRKGVRVYKHKKSKIISIAAEGRLPGSPEFVRRVLLDYEAQQGKIARVSTSKVLSKNKKRLIVYQRLNLPVISDRDFNLMVTWGQKSDVYWIDYRALWRGGKPPVSGVVRVLTHVGSWQLKPISGGRETYARLLTRIDMAGWLPRWLARSKAGEEVPELYEDMRRLIKSAMKKSNKQRRKTTQQSPAQ